MTDNEVVQKVSFPYVLEIDDDDMTLKEGWCISCEWNEGPCLPGGTINWGSGATCKNPERIKDDLEDYDDVDPNDPDEQYALYYRLESIIAPEDAVCEHWKRSFETPLKYGVKQVEMENSNNCPHCEKVSRPNEGSSVAYEDGLVVITCGYCERSYFYVDAQDD